MKRNIFFVTLLLHAGIFNAVIAQTETQAAWSTKFKSPLNWQRLHSLGYIIASSDDALYGINPTDGSIMWENKNFRALDPSSYEEVEGTEFITITYQTDQQSSFPMQAIVEVATGKTLFDSSKAGIGVLSRHVLPESGKLLVIGAAKGSLVATLFMYDIASGSLLWSNDELFKVESSGNGFFAKLQAGMQSLSNLQGLIAEPLELDGQSMIITHPGYIMRIKTATGDVIWKNSIERATLGRVLFSPYRNNVVYLATEVESETGSGFTTGSSGQGQTQKYYYNLYYAFDINSGKPLWKNPAKETDRLNQIIMDERGIIICPRSSQKPTINLVDYENGETLWGKKGKGIKAQGSVVSYIPTGKGLLITTGFDNAFNNKGEEYYLNILDPATGTLVYEKSIKLKGDLVRSELTPKGLLFATTREINILDINTGSLLWDKSIEAGGPATGDKVRPFPIGAGKEKLYVFSPKEAGLFEVDKQSGTYRKMTLAKIEFEGKELPKAIDVTDQGIILYSEQNIMKIAPSGAIEYSRYYPAPRQPALVRALLAAEAVRAAYIGAAASAYAAALADASAKTSDPAMKAVGNEFSKAYSGLGQAGFAYSSKAMKAFNERFKASQNAPGFIMMMTKQEKKGNQLIQVDKTSGEVQNAIDIKNDREPEYEVDQIFNYVYYRPVPSEIVCYKL
jgi:outer membrane protein assembly factor BamB